MKNVLWPSSLSSSETIKLGFAFGGDLPGLQNAANRRPTCCSCTWLFACLFTKGTLWFLEVQLHKQYPVDIGSQVRWWCSWRRNIYLLQSKQQQNQPFLEAFLNCLLPPLKGTLFPRVLYNWGGCWDNSFHSPVHLRVTVSCCVNFCPSADEKASACRSWRQIRQLENRWGKYHKLAFKALESGMKTNIPRQVYRDPSYFYAKQADDPG